jgi:hypothetical protein
MSVSQWRFVLCLREFSQVHHSDLAGPVHPGRFWRECWRLVCLLPLVLFLAFLPVGFFSHFLKEKVGEFGYILMVSNAIIPEDVTIVPFLVF